MKSRFAPLIIIAIAAIVLIAIITLGRVTQPPSTRLAVTASFYPLAEFARQIGGNRVTVTTLVRPGVEPHDYDPTPQDLVNLYRSRLFIYNGAGLEHWVERLQPELRANHVAVVEATSGLPLRPATTRSAEPGDATQSTSSTQATAADPHVWLDPVLAQAQVDAIATALAQADPAGATTYHTNAATLKLRLSALDRAYAVGLANCSRRDLVTSHQAFGYLAARYNLTALPIAGLSPDDEPSPADLARISQFARDHQVHYIFFESLVSPKLADTIAQEIGARTLVFNPIEGLTPDQIAQGANYFSIQNNNITNLRLALDCK